MIISYNDVNSSKCNEVLHLFNLKDKDRVLKIPQSEMVDTSQITLITGPSGSGKTTFGKRLAVEYEFRTFIDDFNQELPIIDIIDRNFLDSIYYLNLMGLGEPYVYITKYKDLSTGQKFRFNISLMLSEGENKIYIDEFCSYLDRETSKFISFNLVKIARKEKIKLLLITAHEDLIDYINPDLHFYMSLSGECLKCNERKIDVDITSLFSVKKGSYEDYKNLEIFHYSDLLSEEMNELYGAKYYSLYLKNQLVGSAVIRCPYTIDQDDANFILINQNVFILERIILNPMVRGIGITKYFLNSILTDYSNKRIVCYSILSNYIPFLEKSNFVKISNNEYNKSIYYKKLYANETDSSNILENQRQVYVDIVYWQYKLYSNLINSMEVYNRKDFYNFVEEIFSVEDIEEWYEELKYLDMGTYVY